MRPQIFLFTDEQLPELRPVLFKFALIGALFLLGCFLSFIESLSY